MHQGAKLYRVTRNSRREPWLETWYIIGESAGEVQISARSPAGEAIKRTEIGLTIFTTQRAAFNDFVRQQRSDIAAAQNGLRWALASLETLKAAPKAARRISRR